MTVSLQHDVVLVKLVYMCIKKLYDSDFIFFVNCRVKLLTHTRYHKNKSFGQYVCVTVLI